MDVLAVSFLTPCNRCTLTDIEAAARRRNATVTVRRETVAEASAKMGDGKLHDGWYVVTVSDQPEPVAYFMELTEGCAC